ncbi:MAG TPA: ComEC/Rec2 family competence protein [Pseudobacteroides sp.]|nr:ComEC/Rec2 family competence protein [Pseudobacteroides sp.]
MKTKIILFIIIIAFFSSCSYTGNTDYRIHEEPSNTASVKKDEPLESQPAVQPSLLKVHFIDVGQGDSILILTPSGKTMLIDGGKNDKANFVKDYIGSLGLNKIDVVVGTHPHEDHIGGLDVVIDNFDIGSIYLPKKTNNTKTFEDLLVSVKNKGLKIKTAAADTEINIDPEINVQMLAPINTDYDDINNYSAVIKVSYKNNSFLFTGDAESLSEKEILSKGYDIKADVLKVGHHGSNSSTSSKFLQKVSPDFAVISVGLNNEYNHPHKAILERLSSANVKIYRTDEHGTIIAYSDGNTIKFETAKE